MQRRTHLLFPSLILLLALLVGCKSNTPAPVVSPTPAPVATRAATATAAAKPVGPVTEVTFGEVARVASYGFAYPRIDGYTLDDQPGGVSMQAPDAGTNSGPGFFLTGGNPAEFGAEGPDAVSGVVTYFLSALVPAEDSVVEERRKIAVHQVPGQDVDFAVFGDEPFRGRITVLQRSDEQVFVLIGLSPPDRWDDEIKPVYRDLLDSITLFDPVAP